MNEWDELVSKQTVIDEINKWLNNFLEDRRDLSDVIKQLPPAQTEIIHCNDCKYYDPIYTGGEGVCGHWHAKTENNAYCYYAMKDIYSGFMQTM